MSTDIATTTAQPPAKQNPAALFRRNAINVATSLLKEWVGEERSKEATGRISAALKTSVRDDDVDRLKREFAEALSARDS